jgi:hypothetical protein
VRQWLWVIAALPLCAAALAGQDRFAEMSGGREVYHAACASCHGADGRGAPDNVRGFEAPDTFPDFTDCRATARESDGFWGAVIHNGGPARGFSEIMPSFREALSAHQVDEVMGHLRTFCREPAWLRGEMNLPRPLVTEKAFPEDEMVLDLAFGAEGSPAITSEIVYEKRLGPRGQLDFILPFHFEKREGESWRSGVGDIVAGYKHVLAADLDRGALLAAAGEVKLATGDSARGRGKGVTVFEGFGSYAQLLPRSAFLQVQAGVELPTDTELANRAVFWRVVGGKTFAQGLGMGRQWSPMVELLADRELASGERVNWDVVPQFQVTLSRRQHIRANLGLRVPLNDFGPRTTEVLFYLMWDMFDGGVFDGWK